MCQRAAPRVREALEENLPRRLMPEQRSDQMTMLVELRGSSDQRHDAIGACQLEDAVDVHVVEPMGEAPE